MCRLTREVQRSLLKRGKLSKAEYQALRTPVDIDAYDDSINAPLRRAAWGGKRGVYLRDIKYSAFIYLTDKSNNET